MLKVCVTEKSEVANQYAVKVSNALACALNLTNRGVKIRNIIIGEWYVFGSRDMHCKRTCIMMSVINLGITLILIVR